MKTGYRVKYRYDGETRAAETLERPGKYLKLESQGGVFRNHRVIDRN